jgi:hypothetical protein
MFVTNNQAEIRMLNIDAACYWAETGILVQKNRRYRIKVVDMSAVRDGDIAVQDLEGL